MDMKLILDVHLEYEVATAATTIGARCEAVVSGMMFMVMIAVGGFVVISQVFSLTLQATSCAFWTAFWGHQRFCSIAPADDQIMISFYFSLSLSLY